MLLNKYETPCEKHNQDDWLLFYETKRQHEHKKKVYQWYCPHCMKHAINDVTTHIPSKYRTQARSIRNFHKVVNKYFLEKNDKKTGKTTESIQSICDNLNRIFSSC